MIDKSKVKATYNGKIGCMCGCKGRYAVETEALRNEYNVACGYEALDTVNPRSVAIAVNKVNKVMAMTEEEMMVNDTTLDVTEKYVSITNMERMTVVYYNL